MSISNPNNEKSVQVQLQEYHEEKESSISLKDTEVDLALVDRHIINRMLFEDFSYYNQLL